MKYFSKDFIQFLKELRENNNKDWFDKNRNRYEQEVKLPFEKFIGDLILAIQAFDPVIQINPKKAIFRINRDIRFSNDKTPYKVHRSAVLARESRKEEYPAYYLRIDPDTLFIGGGVFNLSKDSLYKVREEIMYNEKAFNALIEDKDFKRNFGEIKGEKNKILKPPFKEVADESPILYHKQFYYMQQFDNQKILSEDLIEFIAEKYRSAVGVNKFLQLPLEEA